MRTGRMGKKNKRIKKQGAGGQIETDLRMLNRRLTMGEV